MSGPPTGGHGSPSRGEAGDTDKLAHANRNLVPADLEQYLREHGGPVRCCPHWPECSHMLDWYEKHERAALDGGR